MKSIARVMLALSPMLAATACVGSGVIGTAPSACSSVLPPNWEKGVGQAEPPAPAPPKPVGAEAELAWTLDELKKWTGFALDQSGRVDQADGRYVDAVGIVRRCEGRDAAAVRAARPKFLGLF